MEILWFVGLAVLFVGSLVLGHHLEARRRAALRSFALTHGLQYTDHDPFGVVAWPFTLFRRGQGRGIEHVVWGTWDGEPMQAFDYWYFIETGDSKGGRSRHYRRFSCALIEIDAAFPHLEMTREGLFTRLADHLGFEDIAFESPEFNRRYNVTSEDRKFAYELLDARMLEWLVGFDQGLSFEVIGNRILGYQPRGKPSGFLPLIGTVAMFRRRIPRVALNLYPLSG